jgi:hypothetical protein
VPYVSNKQRRFFNANREEIGAETVDEWNDKTRGKKLPESAPKKKKGAKCGAKGDLLAWAEKRAG